MNTLFLHGLDSSGRGTKGRFFSNNFKGVLCPDFSGSLAERLARLETIVAGQSALTLIGSSFGGLMATCFATRHAQTRPPRLRRLILLAPALNYENYTPPAEKLTVPTLVVIGRADTVTPPQQVVPLVEASFAELDLRLVDDDHLLHTTFTRLTWESLLEIRS